MAQGGAAGVGAGLLAVGAIGAALVVVTLLDVFIAIFDYDGFTFVSARFHHHDGVAELGVRGDGSHSLGYELRESAAQEPSVA